MVDWPVLSTVTALRGFLGLTSYYHNFNRQYAAIATPLTDLLRANDFAWIPAINATFLALKVAIGVVLPQQRRNRANGKSATSSIILKVHQFINTISRTKLACSVNCQGESNIVAAMGFPTCVKRRATLMKIRWSKPDRGGIKINTDGGSKGNTGQAGANGITENKEGVAIFALDEFIGEATNMYAERELEGNNAADQLANLACSSKSSKVFWGVELHGHITGLIPHAAECPLRCSILHAVALLGLQRSCCCNISTVAPYNNDGNPDLITQLGLFRLIATNLTFLVNTDTSCSSPFNTSGKPHGSNNMRVTFPITQGGKFRSADCVDELVNFKDYPSRIEIMATVFGVIPL
ncbi:hypothetical protein Salat_2549700 [Sesamum alatum]|uniref:RNase H type-1 domain-containing protein n=1 Tax=Sesamum alatum TaxID=300844 RepID=A0AAE1XTC7_9LAMI|nr:hypothetical protein Salat_2549700 [Sesamum alatum]